MLTTTNPEQLFTSNFRWYSQDDGNFTVASLAHTFNVPRTSLTKVHQLLPDALEAKLDYLHNNDDKSRVYGDELHWLATYLRHGAMHFIDATGKDLYVPVIYSLKEVEGDEGFVEMECWDFNVTHITDASGQVDLPIIISGDHQTARLRKSDVERHYPGWEQRLAIGRELGVTTTELARMAFQKRSLTAMNTSLPALSFD